MPRAAPFFTERSASEPAARFDLRVERIEGGKFRAKVVDALASVEFPAPFTPDELEKLRHKVESAHRELIRASGDRDPEQLIKDLGRRLFEAVFSGTVRDAWIAKTASSNGKKLVLRLLLHDPELVLWPWEYLHDAVDFLELYRKLSIVRCPLDPVVITPLSISRPFRILGVISSPKGCQPLSGGVEWRNLNESLAHLIRRRRVALELLERPTLASLHDRLSDPKSPRCHAVHFIGHGGFERDPQGRGHGGLYFEDENGHADLVTAEELGTIFAGRDLRLVVLNACNGARSDPDNLFSSVAQNLVRKGVAGVVAMRYAVDDLFAVAFSHRFYRRLADGYPVELALTETRLDLYAQKFKVEWGNPILDLLSSDGQIFEFKQNRWWVLLFSIIGLLLLLLFGSLYWSQREPSMTTPVSGFAETSLSQGRPQVLARPPANPPECPSPSWLGIEFVLIKPGEASNLEPFCIGKYEVTEGQWVRLMGSRWSRKANSRLPAGSKSAEDADLFVEKLNQRDRDSEGEYRLPRKAEWEFAARAGSTERFSFGDNVADLWRFGNCKSELTPDGYEGRPAPVGRFEANDFGLYDTHGNVWEWVSDVETEKSGKPRRIRMGGSWDIQAEKCDVDRSATSPPHTRYSDFGFRIVRKPVAPPQNP